MFERANGTRTLAELAREWPGDRAALDRCLAGLCAAGLLSELLDRLRWEGPPRRVVATSKMFKQLARLTGAPAQRKGPFAHREPGGQARGHPWRFVPARSAGRRRGVDAEVTLSALKDMFLEVFTVATWTEHLRQHDERNTELDRELDVRASTFLAPGATPRVRHFAWAESGWPGRRILGEQPR